MRLWSLRTGICLQTLVGDGERNSLAFNRLFNLVAVGTDNKVKYTSYDDDDGMSELDSSQCISF